MPEISRFYGIIIKMLMITINIISHMFMSIMEKMKHL